MAQLTHELIMERKKNEELLKQLSKMPSRELIIRKRNEKLCKQLREANLKLQALQNADTPSKSKCVPINVA